MEEFNKGRPVLPIEDLDSKSSLRASTTSSSFSMVKTTSDLSHSAFLFEKSLSVLWASFHLFFKSENKFLSRFLHSASKVLVILCFSEKNRSITTKQLSEPSEILFVMSWNNSFRVRQTCCFVTVLCSWSVSEKNFFSIFRGYVTLFRIWSKKKNFNYLIIFLDTQLNSLKKSPRCYSINNVHCTMSNSERICTLHLN